MNRIVIDLGEIKLLLETDASVAATQGLWDDYMDGQEEIVEFLIEQGLSEDFDGYLEYHGYHAQFVNLDATIEHTV